MRSTRISGRVPLRRRLRRPASVLTALAAVIGTSLVAGPATAVAVAPPCALQRTGDHHSLGLDTWNTSYVRPERTLDAVLLFMSFPDSRPITSPAQLTEDYFPATSDFFERASYGRFRLRAKPVEKWIEMPAESRAYDIARDWDSDMRSSYLEDAIAVADRHVDFSAYDVVYFVADPDARGVDSDATKVVNFQDPVPVDGIELRRIVTVFEQYPADRNVLAHETGHIFDLPDLYNRPEDGKGDWDTYVGDWDLMGSQFGLAPDPFGWHKWKLGWLDEAQIDCVLEPGSSLHTLQPLSASLRGRGRGTAGLGARMIAVRTGPTEVLAVEAREAVGNDASLCRSGLLVYRVRSDTASALGPIEVLDGHPGRSACHSSSVHPPLADAPLGEGESMSVDGGAVRVTAADRSDSGEWTVQITKR